ncbi:Fe-S cluster assembly protein SufD [Brevibacillus daliensis]|uniref:Fe-S cluster assembly protein SufD n=1 Tax=Brevibacillus daliensis TaxID=2892995 RepID=UPI001E480C9C|nr:Fe-S cluster assembly protein SufD [Brevibacillus daliensis]
MGTDTQLRFDQEAIKQYSQTNQEPSWFLEQRIAALALTQTLELPKLEKTKIDKWNIDQFHPFQTEASVETIAELAEIVKELVDVQGVSSLLIQKNASVIYKQVADELKAEGVIFTDLATALREHGELVQKYMHTAVKADEHRLVALHAAACNGGTFLYVPKNVEVKVPVQAIYQVAGNDSLIAPHVVIIAEANSRVTYVDSFVNGEGSNMVASSVVEAFVGSNALVQVASVHSVSDQVHDYSFRRAVVEQDGRIEWILGEMNDGNTVAGNESILKGKGSTADTKSITIGTGKQRSNLTSKVQHYGTHTDSQMLSKGVMTDEAVAILNGITKIEKGAEKANGEQAENILMLSEKARGDANPILLIDEDDVTAGHAASVGRVSEESLYYLMSRGIERRQAERLVIIGFLDPVVAEIPIEGVKDRLRQAIERKLG